MSKTKHFATLDTLRGIAALLVLIFHIINPLSFSFDLPHAQLAVDFFFLLSGFVIANAYEKRLQTGLSASRFLTIRAIRLYPLALCGLAGGFLVFLIRSWHSHEALAPVSLLALVTGAMLLPFPFKLPSAQGWVSVFPFNPPSWSLFFELLANVVYSLLVRRLTTRILSWIVLAAGITLFYQGAIVGNLTGGNTWNQLYLGLGRVTFPFFAGIWLFRLVGGNDTRKLKFAAQWLSALLLVLVLCSPSTKYDFIFEPLAVVFAFPLIVFLGAAASEPGRVAKHLSLSAGQLSYPLYVTHYPLVHLFGNYFRTHRLSGFHLVLGVSSEIVTAVIMSYLLMKVFDEPVRAFLNRRLIASESRQKCSVMVGVGSI